MPTGGKLPCQGVSGDLGSRDAAEVPALSWMLQEEGVTSAPCGRPCEPSIEKRFGKNIMTRTGIITKHRRCPRHGAPLEVAVVDDCNASTCLEWWCGRCGGYWSELYFTMRVEADLPLMGLVRNFQFGCPRCGSLRTSRDCNFDCCDYHACNDCQQTFFIDYEITQRSTLAEAEIVALKAKHWLDGSNVISAFNDERFEHHEVSVASPYCKSHPDTPVTLVVDPSATDERFRFGWFCKECDTVMFDYMNPYPRRDRSFFLLTDRPDFRCRICHHCDFDQKEDLTNVTCRTCGTSFSLRASTT